MHGYVVSTLVFLGMVTVTSAVMSAPRDTSKRIEIPVQGLDAERGPNVERALRVLESEGKPHVKVLAEVEVDVEKGSLSLLVTPGQSLRLKQVERALNATNVRIQGDRFALGASRIVFEGEVGEDVLEKLKTALTTDLFASAEVRREEDPPRLVADVVPGEDPAMLDSAAKAARSVSPKLRIADVVWSRPKAR
ncbi:MAG TPA: hypothetical protein VMT18_07125 [Planctomycetota bacterium]|nr:hypothetical protein [Planctomycetota bacterium]